jgi:hypothetical protein
MKTLLLDGLLPAHSDFVDELSEANPFLGPLIICFILLASLTVMNMLVGVLVEVVGVVASTEKEKMSVLGVKHDIQDAMDFLNMDSKKPISQEQFVRMLMNPEMLNTIQGLGIDTFALVDATDYIFSGLEKEAEAKKVKTPAGLTFEAFVDILLKMRGKNTATVGDVNENTRFMRYMISKLEGSIEDMRMIMRKEFLILGRDVRESLGIFDGDENSEPLEGDVGRRRASIGSNTSWRRSPYNLSIPGGSPRDQGNLFGHSNSNPNSRTGSRNPSISIEDAHGMEDIPSRLSMEPVEEFSP